MLSGIRPSYFCTLFELSYIVYADSLQVLSRTKSILGLFVQCISMMFRKTGLALSINKYKYLFFNSKSSAHNMLCGSSIIHNISSLLWLGISIFVLHSLFCDSRFWEMIKKSWRLDIRKLYLSMKKNSRQVLLKCFPFTVTILSYF